MEPGNYQDVPVKVAFLKEWTRGGGGTKQINEGRGAKAGIYPNSFIYNFMA
jgi:hypothetical protein